MITLYCLMMLNGDYSGLLQKLQEGEMAIIRLAEESRVIEEKRSFNGLCPICQKLGIRSKVYVGPTFSTLMGWTIYYDELGVLHNDDPNRHETSFSCSRGHEFVEVRQGRSVILRYLFPQKKLGDPTASFAGQIVDASGDTIWINGGDDFKLIWERGSIQSQLPTD